MIRGLLLVVALALPVVGAAQIERHADVRLQVSDAAALLEAAGRAGVAIDHGAWEETDAGVALRTTLAESDVQAFRAAGVGVEVIVPDVTAAVAARAGLGPCPVTPYPVTGTMGCYPTHDQALAILDAMRAQHPDIVSQRVSIGTSIEGRQIWMVEITDNPGVEEGEAQVLFTALHHAREPQGLATVLHTMWDLLERHGADEEATYLVRNRRMFFIPILNPDGYVYNETDAPAGGGMWRKNRRDNGGGSFGVDLNRNYGYNWAFDDSGSSPNPFSETYRGSGPFSEPETAAIRDFINARQVRVAFNYHSFSNLLLHPWGYTATPPPDMAEFTEQSRAMTAVNGYVYGPGNTTIYPTNGSSDDWMYGDTASRPAIFSYTPEVGADADGFWPEPARIEPLAEENRRANYLAAWYAGEYLQPSTVAYSEDETGGNGHIDPGEHFLASATLVNVGHATARFVDLVALSGSPHIEILCCPLPVLVDIAPGDSASFTFPGRVLPGAPLGYLPAVALEVRADGELMPTIDLRPLRVGTPVNVVSDPANAMAGWTAAGGWGLSGVASSPPTSFSDSPSGNYPNNANATLTLAAPVDLGFADGATLRFRTRWDIQHDFDFAQVLASADGSTWVPLVGRHTVPGSGTGAQPAGEPGLEGSLLDWVTEEMDLSAFAGSAAVHLRFRLRSNGSTRRDGWWVDDIVLDGLIDGSTTGIEEPAADRPTVAVSPNPSSGAPSVTVWLPAANDMRLEVFDALGRRVAILHDGTTPAGSSVFLWEGRGEAGHLAPGVYVVRLETGGSVSTTRVTILQ